MTDKALLKHRDELLQQLSQSATRMLIGSVSETYRTCGQPTCRCHSTGPKHGPHLYVSYLGEHGKTTGYYVRKAIEADVREGLAAWKQFQALAKDLAHLNRQVLQASVAQPSSPSKRKRSPKASASSASAKSRATGPNRKRKQASHQPGGKRRPRER